MNTFRSCVRSFLLLYLFCITSNSIIAQADLLNWNGVTVTGTVTKKLSAKISHTRAYNINKQYQNIFNQSQFQLAYEMNKKWDVQAGIQLIASPDTNDARKRIFTRVSYNSRLSKKVNLLNTIRLETNSKNELTTIVPHTQEGLIQWFSLLKVLPRPGKITCNNIKTKCDK